MPRLWTGEFCKQRNVPKMWVLAHSRPGSVNERFTIGTTAARGIHSQSDAVRAINPGPAISVIRECFIRGTSAATIWISGRAHNEPETGDGRYVFGPWMP